MKIVQRIFLFAFLTVLLSACAVGNRHRYHDTVADINFAGVIAIAVTAQDQRDYIIAGRKSPNFVGLQRGGYGNPFDVRTASGNALAYDMTYSIVNSLLSKGYKAVPISVNPKDDRHAVIAKLKATGAELFLVLTLSEWKSDTYQNTALIYDMKVAILDRDGKIKGQNGIKGRDNLGGSFWDPTAHAKEAVPNAFKEKIEKLLNSEEVISALNLSP